MKTIQWHIQPLETRTVSILRKSDHRGQRRSKKPIFRRRPPQQSQGKECNNCGYTHSTKWECPAWGKDCMKCGIKNHFAAKCRQKEVKATDEVEEESDEIYQTEEISAVKLDDSQLVTVKLESGSFIRFQPDTGAQCNVIPLNIYRKASKDSKLEKVRPIKTSSRCLWGLQDKSRRASSYPACGGVRSDACWIAD